MTFPRRILIAPGLAAASALVLAGCAGADAGDGGAGAADEDAFTIVTSTNVYGDIARQIAGDAAAVEEIISSTAQDPHEYEATAADQLTVERADLVIENGGGYDSFLDGIIESTGTDAHVITAAEFSHSWPGEDGEHDHSDEEHSDEEHDHADEAHADEEHSEDEHDHEHSEDEEHADEEHEHSDEEHSEHEHDHAGHNHIEGFNEHVWYDPHTMEHLAEAIADELSEALPDDADTFAANLETFTASIGELEANLAQLETEYAGAQVFVTEPVPGYLVEAAGLVVATPSEFSEAVEEGQDVPPATLLEATELVESGDIAVLIANTQTGGAETEQVIATAEENGVTVIEFSETLPDGLTYSEWMQENIDALSGALAE